MSADWLVGPDRSRSAQIRLHAIAADLIAERGIDRLDLDVLASRAHCSRATLYRHTGGKKHIVDAVLVHTSSRITGVVRDAVVGRVGTDRACLAMTVAIREIRADPVARRFLQSRNAAANAQVAIDSPAVSAIAAELIGLDPRDLAGIALAVRLLVAMMLWPPPSPVDEPDVIRPLVAALLTPAEMPCGTPERGCYPTPLEAPGPA